MALLLTTVLADVLGWNSELHVTHNRIYSKQRTLQASFEKYSHSKLYVLAHHC